jgi:N-acetylmuramoyl-L-alanine amidase
LPEREETAVPSIYLSPSTQEWNAYVTGSGSEEYNMNLLADALIPYLQANAIRYTRNSPDMTAASSIRQANEGDYDFYLALHSNASGEGHYGENRGIIAFYYPGSARGERGAELIAQALQAVYPLPKQVRAQSAVTLGEVRLSRFPAVLVEIGYHDNYADAAWVESHMDAIAQSLARALTEYFGLPFVFPGGERIGTVAVAEGSTLNLRETPSPEGTVLANLPAGASVRVFGEREGWYTVEWKDFAGYAAAAYIALP